MKIWVDADACPKAIKEILFRAAERKQTKMVLVANQALKIPLSSYITSIQVAPGFDMADHYIVQHLLPKDLVITADILLADAVISKNGVALNPRGELYSMQNIKHRVSVRNLSEELRGQGLIAGGPNKLSSKEIRNFANHLDQWLAKRSQTL